MTISLGINLRTTGGRYLSEHKKKETIRTADLVLREIQYALRVFGYFCLFLFFNFRTGPVDE